MPRPADRTEPVLRAAEYFGLPVEAIISRQPFAPMSSQLYPSR